MSADYTNTLTNYNNMKKLIEAHKALHRMYGCTDFSYCDTSLKRGLHKDSAAYLRMLAEQLALPEDSYEIRQSEGGIAGSGEITLHSGSLYVQISQWSGYAGVMFLIRGCRSRADYTGGTNNTVKLKAVNVRLVLDTCAREIRIITAQKEVHDKLTLAAAGKSVTKAITLMVALDVEVPAHFDDDDIDDITFNIPVADIGVYSEGYLLAYAFVSGYTTQEYYADPE